MSDIAGSPIPLAPYSGSDEPTASEVPTHPGAEDQSEDAQLSPVEELEALLYNDETRLGDVYRGIYVDKLSPPRIAEKHKVSNSGFVSNYDKQINAALYGTPTTSRSLESATEGTIRSLLRKAGDSISEEARNLLKQNLSTIQAFYAAHSSEIGGQVSDSDIERETTSAASAVSTQPGIYAFSYGWYLENPVDGTSNTTLIKVGKARNVGVRILEHQRAANSVTTHMPEPITLLRVYSTALDQLDQAERTFHKLLTTAGHENPRRRIIGRKSETGKEWYMTNPEFLDAIADALDLATEYIGKSDFGD